MQCSRSIKPSPSTSNPAPGGRTQLGDHLYGYQKHMDKLKQNTSDLLILRRHHRRRLRPRHDLNRSRVRFVRQLPLAHRAVVVDILIALVAQEHGPADEADEALYHSVGTSTIITFEP